MIEVESIPHPERRNRKAMMAATAMAMIGATGGFLVGRSTGQPAASVGAAPSSAAPSRVPETAAAPTATDAPASTTPSLAGDVQMAGPAVVPYGIYNGGGYEEPQQELLTERTTASGVLLRAHLLRSPEGEMQFGGPVGWKPAGWCFPSGSIRVSVVAPTSVNVSGAPWYAELRNGLAVSAFASGYAEGSPLFGVVAQVDPDVVRVSMTTASGLTDSASPVRGVVLLEVDGKIQQEVTIAITKADGTATDHSLAEFTQPWTTPDYHAVCDPPPPALPDAGPQPADPAAAEAAIRSNWEIVHDFAGDTSSRRSYLDDDTVVADAWKALQEGQYADAAKASTSNIAALVFRSPTEAWFRYDVLTPITNFFDRYGRATSGPDGVWVFTRQTICQDIALAPGFGCAPPVDTLLPPSAANDPRYNPQAPAETVPGGD